MAPPPPQDDAVTGEVEVADVLDGVSRAHRTPTWARRAALTVALARLAAPLIAIPFIPALIPDRMLELILLRPGKEFLLLGGGLNRTTGDPSVAGMLAAYAFPMIVAVWAFFLLGRIYGDRLRDGTAPSWMGKMVSDDQLETATNVLARKGPVIALLGRLAAFPPTVLALAAGASDIDARRYLGADLFGAFASFGVAVGIGMALGDAYERGSTWITVGGVALFAVGIILMTRWIKNEAENGDG